MLAPASLERGAMNILTGPYVRFAAPGPGRTDLAGSTYLRLGSYVVDDETALVPATAGAASDASGIATTARVTTSTTSRQVYDSAKAFAEAQQPGSPTSLEQAVTVLTSSPLAPSGAGLLLYSHEDLFVKADGSAFIQYGGGQGTVVLGGDSETDVPAGQYRLNALNGVALTAGTSATPADIVLRAYNSVSLTSLGPSDSATYGNSSSETHGDSRSVTYGSSYAEFHGDQTSIFLGNSKTWALDDDVTGKLANSLLLFAGTLTSIVLGASISVVVGNMSYVYLLTYAELYAAGFISVKMGAELYIKDTMVKYAATEVSAGALQANVVDARADAADIDLRTVEMAMQKRTVKFDANGTVTEMSETRMIMAAMSVHV